MNKAANILVTGGLGYIGSHTVVSLIEQGFNVVIVDNLSNSSLSVLDGIEGITNKRPEFHQVDLLDAEKMDALFQTQRFDGVIHFAAFKAVGESVQNPLKYYRNNLGSLENLLTCMDAHDVQYLIFSSSCTVYGQASTLPITEMAPLKTPESPYGKTKMMGEQIIIDLCQASSLKSIALRYFNPIGAHPTAKIGELPIGHPDNLVPYITQTAAGIREQLSIFGKDYDTDDGTCVRDYIHVCDLAEAHVVALNRLLNIQPESNFEVFNLGTGTGFSVLELVTTFEKVTGEKLNYRFVERRAGDITAAFADTNKAKNILGWEPKRGINEMLNSAWNWQKTL